MHKQLLSTRLISVKKMLFMRRCYYSCNDATGIPMSISPVGCMLSLINYCKRLDSQKKKSIFAVIYLNLIFSKL